MAAHVAAAGAADLLVLVGVDEGADAFVGEDLGQQPLVDVAVDDVDARHAGLAGGGRVAGLRELAGVHRPLLERVGELGHRELAGERVAHRRGRRWW